MTSEYAYRQPSRVDTALVRDVLALVLILGGIVGLAVIAFATDWRLGVGLLSIAAVSAGGYLGYNRG